jgi:hypothetical protein
MSRFPPSKRRNPEKEERHTGFIPEGNGMAGELVTNYFHQIAKKTGWIYCFQAFWEGGYAKQGETSYAGSLQKYEASTGRILFDSFASDKCL